MATVTIGGAIEDDQASAHRKRDHRPAAAILYVEPTEPVIPPDTTAPTVTLVSPSDRQLSASEAVVFDVVDNEGDFARIIFAVAFPSLGTTELAHDGGNFIDAYAASSTRIAIANGWRYSLIRSGGWRASPRARVFATDGSGNNES